MGSTRITPGSSTPSVEFYALRADVPVTLTSAEAGLAISWLRQLEGIPLAASYTALTLADLGAMNSAHSAGGLIVKNAATGLHRLDIPASAVLSGADEVEFSWSATDTDLVLVFPHVSIDADVQGVETKVDTVDNEIATLQSSVDDVQDDVDAANLAITDVQEDVTNILANTAYPGGRVCVDTRNGVAGTVENVNGTLGNPCSTVADAITIANARGIKRILNLNEGWFTGLGDSEIPSGDLSFFDIDLNGGQWRINSAVTNFVTTWRNGTLGYANGDRFSLGTTSRYYHILFSGGITWSVGSGAYYPFWDCTFFGDSFGVNFLFETPTAGNRLAFVSCWFFRGGTVEDAPVVFDANDHAISLLFEDCHGDMEIRNMTAANSLIVHYGWGKLIVDSTCTTGTIRHGAHVEIFDENGDPYDGAVTTELVSEPGGVSSFTGTASTQISSIQTSIDDIQTDLDNGVDIATIEGTDATDYFTSMIAAIVAAMQTAGTYLARLFGLIENTGVYDRFTTAALEQAPTGAGGGSVTVDSFSATALAQLQGIAEFSPLVYIDQIKQEINLVAGDDYLHADGRSLQFTLMEGESWPADLDTLASIEWAYRDEDGTVVATVVGTVGTATGSNRSFHFDITADDIPNSGIFFWDCQFTDSSGNKWTPRLGMLRIIEDAVA